MLSWAASSALVFLEGRTHQRHRRLLSSAFHGESLHYWSRSICRITQYVLDQPQYRLVLPLHEALKEVALRVILQVLLGGLGSPARRELYQLLYHFFQDADSPLSAIGMLFPALRIDLGSSSPWGRFVRQQARINQLIEDQIDRQKTAGLQDGTLLAMLLEARDESGQGLSDAEIRDELLMLIFAGYETTTSAIAWALYWIHYCPEIKAQLKAELDQVDSFDNPMQFADLPYLNAVAQEALRLYPVAIGCFARRVLQPFDLYLAHHRAAAYPDATVFRPQRFLERQFSPYEYLPLGSGTRRCIGAEFARLEMKLVVTTILKQMQLATVDSTPIHPVRHGITMALPVELRLQMLKPMEIVPFR